MEVLRDNGFRSFDYVSRYAAFPYYYHGEDDRYVYGTTAQLSKDIGYAIHVVRKNDTFDSIALDYYNSPTLYWIICDFNNVQDPFTKLEEGEHIKVPVLSAIAFNLTEAQNKN